MLQPPPIKTDVMFHPYLPITATTLESVPKVAVVERFDGTYRNTD